MAKYTAQAISGYNTSPPSDDGTQTAANEITWAKHKTKLADPVKTLAEGIDTAITAMAATTFLNDVEAKTANFTVAAANQGSIFTTTNAITATLTSAATLGKGFACALINSDASSDLTIDPDGSETVGGKTTLTVGPKQGVSIVSDGTNWQVAGTVLGPGTQGDIFYANASGAITALAAGTVGYALISGGAGANPSWAKTPTGSAQSSSPGTTVATSTLTATGGTLSVTPTGASRKLHVVMAINCTISASASAGGFKTRPLYVNSSSVNTATSIQKTSHAGNNATATSVINTMTAVHVFVLASSEVNASGNWEIGQFMANNGTGTATLNNVEIVYMEMGE